MSNITIYHNPACGTSRNTLEMIRNSGTEDKFTDDRLIDFMLQHPILINRPIVVTPLGTRLCRPSEVVLEILPDAQKGAFSKEDGEKVVDEAGKRLK
ncbi:MAG: ArsC/Spx/MgsR family protein [Escherichia coli]|nr:ArsC/Spx/MgsR family protein [Escherichia coli]